MYTAGQLIQQLAALDPSTPIGIIDIDRQPHSQRATITLRNLVDIDVVHDPRDGTPQAVWLDAQPAPDVELPSRPHTVVLPRDPCGCLVAIPIGVASNTNLDAVPCAHHQPDELIVRSSRR